MRQFVNLIVPIALVTGLAITMHGQMELQERLSSLDARLVRLDARAGGAAETRVVYRAAQTAPDVPARVAAPALPDAQATADKHMTDDASDAIVPTPSIAAEVTDRGYMYAGEWEDMEPRLAAMSPEENKKFWEEMFDAIGTGALEVYDE